MSWGVQLALLLGRHNQAKGHEMKKTKKRRNQSQSQSSQSALKWWCEYTEKVMPWAANIWPTFCPLCGRGVNRQLSTHHELAEVQHMTEFTKK